LLGKTSDYLPEKNKQETIAQKTIKIPTNAFYLNNSSICKNTYNKPICIPISGLPQNFQIQGQFSTNPVTISFIRRNNNMISEDYIFIG
jgi:hypothetical protein